MPQLQMGQLLMGTVIAAVVGISGFMMLPSPTDTETAITLEPNQGTYVVGESFTVTLSATARTPVNVWQADLTFATDILEITSIDYNSSIIDLWTTTPWFSNGAGTFNFAGGTTDPGGFTGTDTLVTITFTTLAPGDGALTIADARVLKHDGLGNDATIADPIAAVFAVSETETDGPLPPAETDTTLFRVLAETPNTDLNQDGEQTLADLSIFMRYLTLSDIRGDLNQDGAVTMADLSIMLDAE